MELEIYPSVFRAETLMENDPETIVLFGPDALTQLGIHFQMEHCETILLGMGGNSSENPISTCPDRRESRPNPIRTMFGQSSKP